MQYDYDVVVIGARVAGASTAMLLARQGHRVLLVDRANLPADTVSTHALLRTGVLQLTRWGVRDAAVGGAPPIRNVTLGFGDERVRFEVRHEFGIEAFHAPRRLVLDKALLDAAVDAGVTFQGETRVTDLRRDEEDRVNGVKVKSPGGSMTISSRCVVGADGVHSRIAKLIDAPILRAHPPRNAIHYAYFDGIADGGFWFQFTPGVNAGLIPTNDGLTCVFVGRPSGKYPAFRADPDTEFRRLVEAAGSDLAQRVAGGSRSSPFRGTSGLPGVIRQPWGSGWALVGDAGYTKDPISAHGISDALRDAELCARAIDIALRDPASEVEALKRYQGMRDSLSWDMFEESQALAGYEWDAEEASARMRQISASVRQECRTLSALGEWPRLMSAMAS